MVSSRRRGRETCSSKGDTVATTSFYSKRAQSQSPVGRVLKRRKIDSENVDNKLKCKVDCSGFDFTSSDSGDNDRGRSVLKQKNGKQNKTRKNSLEIVKTPKRKSSSSRTSVTKTPIVKVNNENINSEEIQSTPVSNKKKFFKNRSPASADRAFGNIVIGKGFDVKFYPRRHSVGASARKATKKCEVKPKPKFVKSVPARLTKPFVWSSDGTSCDEGVPSVVNKGVQDYKNEPKLTENQDSTAAVESDSGLCLPQSADTPSIKPNEETPELFSEDNSNCDSDSMSNETLSVVGVGSQDLFSNSEISTPDPSIAGETPTEVTPSQSITASPSRSGKPESQILTNSSCEETPTQTKLFPIFFHRSQGSSSQKSKASPKVSPCVSRSLSRSLNNSPMLKVVKSRDGLEQMTIDAGQKRFGATRCDTCGMVYSMSEPADEAEHNRFHQSLLNALKFPGWKKENVVHEDVYTGSRIIMVSADSPKYATKKIEDINRIMGQELGFPEPGLTFKNSYKSFLYISEDKKIQGCCVSEPVTEGHRVLPEEPSESSRHSGERPWCCSDEAEEASIGISRIWVYRQARQQGIATKLLDCVRQWSVYGSVIPKHKVAFSDPTPDGKRLASKYCGTPNFLVYKFQ